MAAARPELPPLEGSPIWLLGHRYDPESSGGPQDELHLGGSHKPHAVPAARAPDGDGTGQQRQVLGNQQQCVHSAQLTAPSDSIHDGGEDAEDCGPPTVFTLLHGAERRWASFLAHFRSLVWCTYRSGFSRLGSQGYTSDMGWGCMLRTGQMVLAQALTRHLLGPGADSIAWLVICDSLTCIPLLQNGGGRGANALRSTSRYRNNTVWASNH